MNNEPVAWMNSLVKWDIAVAQDITHDIPLYTHPHPDNLGLALSIIDQQKLEIEALKDHPVKEFFEDEPQAEELHEIMQSNTHPVKEQSNLVNAVKNHIEDLVRCVKLFRSYEMDNTANEMEVAIKELEDAFCTHPVKELTDEEIAIIGDKCFGTMHYELWLQKNEFARAILRKAQDK